MSQKQTTGSRAMVMHGTAKKTSGGLTKSQLKYNLNTTVTYLMCIYFVFEIQLK